jgi:hypothetical protein
MHQSGGEYTPQQGEYKFCFSGLLRDLNPCGKSDQLIVHLYFVKEWHGEAKKREAKLSVKNQKLRFFDAKLRIALLALLR